MSFSHLACIYDRINGEAYLPYAEMLDKAFFTSADYLYTSIVKKLVITAELKSRTVNIIIGN